MNVTRPDWTLLRGKLESLFQASFGRPIQSGFLDWRYFDNGQELLLFSVEMADDNLVASYSAFPVDLVCAGQICRTAMSMTTMTHPQWRGRGLFQKLARELYARAETSGVATVWGFPNVNSHLHFNDKLGWSDIYEIPTKVLDLGRVDVRKLASDAMVAMDSSFALDYPDPPTDGLIRVHRSRSYLVWRYARNPVNSYRNYVLARDGRVSSYVVAKSYGDGIDLVDIQIADAEEARILLAHIVSSSIGKGARHVYCWAPTHHSVHGVLERLGFENSAPVTYFGGRELLANAAPGGWLDYRNWYFQMGDSDVY